jgi:uncharacterized protein (DUF58 family)
MSFRTDRPLAEDRATVAGEESDPDDDPNLTEAMATASLDLRPLLGALLVLAGGLLGSAIVVMLGIVVLIAAWLRWLWASRALRRLRFQRRFEPDRVVCGDVAHLVVTAWNRKLLPLSWLRTEEALPVDLHPTEEGAGRGWTLNGRTLVNGWTLGPYERVVRRIDLRTDHRGVQRLDGFSIEVGDLLGEPIADEERRHAATLIVRPRTVPVRRFDASRDRAGPLRARHGLVDDPSRFAGVRPYVPGDPVRHVDWRTTARVGTPLVKRFDPSRDRDVVIALDIQTADDAWAGRHDDEMAETLCVVASSLARQMEIDGAACGLAVAAFSGTPDRLAYLAPSSAERQAGRVGDLLARISPYPSAPFAHLLGRLARRVRPGTLIVIVSSRGPGSWLAAARRLGQAGFGVVHLAIGPDASEAVRHSRASGIVARSMVLDGDWRTASRLDVAG